MEKKKFPLVFSPAIKVISPGFQHWFSQAGFQSFKNPILLII